MNWSDIVARRLADKSITLGGKFGNEGIGATIGGKKYCTGETCGQCDIVYHFIDADHVGNVKGYSRTSSSSREYIYLSYECQRGHELGHG
jgi:hypothetical protein